MINKVSFKNYKIFKDKQFLELRPLTILIGKNNTGKSAVLKLMTLLEGALGGHNDKVLELNNDGVISGNEYKDLIFGKFSRSLEVEVTQKFENSALQTSLKTNIVVDSTTDLPIIENWKLAEIDDNNNVNVLVNLFRSGKSKYLNEVNETEYNCDFNGIWLANYFNVVNDSSGDVYRQPFLNTDFIGSLREKAKLDYRLNAENQKSNIDGKFLYDFLIRDYLTTEKIYFTKISAWIFEHFEGWTLYVDVDSEPYHIQLRKGNLEIDLTETGMGISQSLPLVIRAFRPCSEETMIIIEEPEAHLHPYAHSEIAQLFAESIKEDKNKNYLIETHSQNFILRLRRLIAEGFLDPKDLGIYYIEFDENKNESKLLEIQVDEFGKVNFWPEGVFSETLEETIGIRTAQISKENVGRN